MDVTEEQTTNEEKLLLAFITGLGELGCEMSCQLTALKEQPATPEVFDEISDIETQLNLIKTEITAYEADLATLRKGA